mgnify:FL=1
MLEIIYTCVVLMQEKEMSNELYVGKLVFDWNSYARTPSSCGLVVSKISRTELDTLNHRCKLLTYGVMYSNVSFAWVVLFSDVLLLVGEGYAWR